jgi:hypothetical protein
MQEFKFPRSTLGPIVNVTISTCEPYGTAAKAGPSSLFHSHSLLMLVDTGSERTVIDETLIDGWGLVYVSAGWAATINGTKPIRSFELAVSLGAPEPAAKLSFARLTVMARRDPFQGAPYRGLLGRDVLNSTVFVCDGPGHACSISY